MIKENSKLKLDIYVPLQVCSCQWENFMNRIFEIITPYSKYIEHETKSLNSKEAAKMKLFQKCVIINGKDKITTPYSLKRKLKQILREKGFIE